MNYNNKIICKNHLKPLPLQTIHQSFRRLTNQDIDSFWAFKATRHVMVESLWLRKDVYERYLLHSNLANSNSEKIRQLSVHVGCIISIPYVRYTI